MAIYNEILEGRFNRALQKLLSMKGKAPSPQLAGEIAAVFPFFWGAENRYLEGWYRYGKAANAVAVAAQTGGVRLRNPTGSNVIIVVEKMHVITTAQDFPFLDHGPQVGDLANVSATSALQRWDPRGSPSTVARISNGTAAAFNDQALQLGLQPNVGFDVINTDIQEIPVLPGEGVQLRCSVVNNAITVSYWWRERPLTDSEQF